MKNTRVRAVFASPEAAVASCRQPTHGTNRPTTERRLNRWHCIGRFRSSPSRRRQWNFALITDIGIIDDKSFNQGAWEGLVKYAEEKGISHQYYQPTEKSTTAYLESIDQAVKNGAKVSRDAGLPVW